MFNWITKSLARTILILLNGMGRFQYLLKSQKAAYPEGCAAF